MPPKHREGQEGEQQFEEPDSGRIAGNEITPSTKVPVSWLMSIAAAVVSMWLVWVTNELNTIKASLFSRSANDKTIEVSLRLLESKVADLESRGSKPMQDLQKAVDKIAEELRIHQVQTERYLQFRQQAADPNHKP